MANDEKYQKGLANRAKVFGAEEEERRKKFEAACPDFARFVTENIYGDLYERKGMDPKIRERIILAILCTKGRDVEFEHHVKTKNSGLQREVAASIKEYLQEVFQKNHGFDLEFPVRMRTRRADSWPSSFCSARAPGTTSCGPSRAVRRRRAWGSCVSSIAPG